MVTTTRAVGITRPGGPDVLRVIEREVREAGPGEVRLAVRAAAVNPTDIGVRQLGVEGQPAPWVPGMDAAGTVESVGTGVEHPSVGDEVMAALSPRRPEGGAPTAGTLLVVPAPELQPGLALLDSPDIDSVLAENRALATQLLAAADAWLFVTTAARYADAVLL